MDRTLKRITDNKNMFFRESYLFFTATALLIGTSMDVNAAPGEGLSFGKFYVSPSLKLNVSYDSNVRRISEDFAEAVGTDVAASAILEVNPALNVAYKTQDLAVSVAYSHLLKQYFSDELSKYSYLDDFTGRVAVDLFSERKVGLSVYEEFAKRNYAGRGATAGDDDSVTGTMKRVYSNLAFDARYSPGSALDIIAGVKWLYDFQDLTNENIENEAIPFKNELGYHLRAKWRFFPKTAWIMDASYANGKWENLSNLGKTDTVSQWGVITGLNGAITESFQLSAFLGYGELHNRDPLIPETDDAKGLHGLMTQMQALYTPIENQVLSLNFARRFADSPVMDYYVSNSFSFAYNGRFKDSKLGLSTVAGLDLRQENSADSAESLTKNNNVLYAGLGIDYKVMPWLTTSFAFKPAYSISKENSESGKTEEELKRLYSYEQYVIAFGIRGFY